MSLLLVAAGAAVGAPLRYLVDRFVQHRTGAGFPWGTLTVNVTGSLLLGFLTEAAGHRVLLLAGVGFCGALTTWSTFGYETVRLAGERARRLAVLNITLTLTAGLSAAALGLWLGHLAT